MTQRLVDYRLIRSLARTEEAGGLASERAVLLLWFLRNSVGIDDLDAYEYVCDGDLDKGVDGMYLEPPAGDGEPATLTVFQSKYTRSPSAIGSNDIKHLVATANHFRSLTNLQAFLGANLGPQLRTLIKRLELERRLRAPKQPIRLRMVLVSTGYLDKDAALEVDAANQVNREGYVSVYDIDRLGPLARAVAKPNTPREAIRLPAVESDRLVTGHSPNRVAVVAVAAKDIVSWGGVDDRRLFALDVRRELRPNRVSEQLDSAIKRSADHRDFLAYHNGLTVVCDYFEIGESEVVAHNPSVVNGAQSVVALARGNASRALTRELRIFVKLVEVRGRPQLAKEVSRRSNTQTAVNPRMLASQAGPQIRLVAEFEAQYPDITYETRPDHSNPAKTGTSISNDAAAQLLCAVYNGRPWLAVKRLSLFESENHALIFNDGITASHIVVADLIGRAIDDEKTEFPSLYRASWRLTRIVASYLVGQILRAGKDDAPGMFLKEPAAALADMQSALRQLRGEARLAAATLKMRQVALEEKQQPDDFNRDFKNEKVLQALGEEVRRNYLLRASLAGGVGL